ncbi:MAG: hypothetical protein HYX28_00270 [Candidatus Koribacter versatilis]|uniref:Uncharacterized protein n=1 Tax=Candidatus Korobacter versatilis TaxID=658062 RepID=A0A932A6A1_9BACT|nr:hypothetical protein [Candidatus Koribacter versatilis]
MRHTLALLTLCAAAFAPIAFGQDQPQQPPATEPKPPEVHVTYLNVCTPPEDEKQLLTASLAHISMKPPFASDFEVARGRTGATTGELAAKLAGGALPPSSWVRVRREFASGYYANVQYSMTRDESGIAEVLVFRVRDPREVMQVAISDGVTSTDPAAVLATDTPAARIKIERFGKSSVGLAHCPGADQKEYQPLFRSANQVLASYRDLMGIRKTVPAEFARIGGAATGKTAAAATKKPATTAPKPKAQKP